MATPISKVTLTIDNRDYVQGLNQASNQTKSFGTEAAAAFNRADDASKKLNLSASNLTGGLLKLRGTLATIGIGAFAVSALQGADAIMDLSSATGISVGKLLEFEKGLQTAGGRAADSAKAITTFYGSIEEANAGSDKAQETFKKLGITLRDLKTLSEEDLLDKTLKGFVNIQDPIAKSRTAIDLFGKSFQTVNPQQLGDELDKLRGQLSAQESATRDAAVAIEQFEKLISALKGAVVIALKPFLEFFGTFKDGEYDVRSMAGSIQSLAAAYVALRVAAFGAAIAQAAAGGGIKGGVAGIATGLAAAALTFKGINELMQQMEGPMPYAGQKAPMGPDATMDEQRAEDKRIREGRNRDDARREREQQIGKELQGQLNSVNQLADGYKRAAQSNMDRYTQEVDILGKTEYEIELIKGRGEIEKRYADNLAALEEKKKGAKGATLALIQQTIDDLNGLKTSEIDIFEITRKQTFEYKLQQEEVKRITDQIEKQLEIQQKLGDSLRSINDQRKDVEFQGSTVGMGSREKEIASIQENSRKAAMEAGRAYAAAFEDSGDGMTAERAQEFADGLSKITEGYQAIAYAQLANLEASRSWEAGWKEAFANYVDDATNAANTSREMFSSAVGSMNSALDKFVETGKLNFGDLARSIIQDLLKIQLRKAAAGFLGSLFGIPGMAQGGPVAGGMPYLIGEQGPELFVPKNAGTIIPNHKLGGNSSTAQPAPVVNNYNYSISAIDAKSVSQLFYENRQTLFGTVEAAKKELPFRR
jgi:lambda family phage tail tape measure protein